MTSLKPQGQDEAWSKLIAYGGNLPQSLLLLGPPGVGKQQAAIALFQFLHCNSPQKNDSCGFCGSCLKIAKGQHPDLFRISAQGEQIVVDDFREFRTKIHFKPIEGKIRMVLINEAHRMNVTTANSLLKTLEEPPNHTRFVLITHEKSLLLPTVLSRCQFIQFTPLPDSIRRPILRKAVERQGLQITEEVETLMLRLLGDGFERLDQLVSEEAISFLKSPSADLDEDWKLELFLDLQVIQNQKQALQELQQSANQFLKSSDVVLHATSRALEAARLRQRLSRYANKKLIALNAAQLGST